MKLITIFIHFKWLHEFLSHSNMIYMKCIIFLCVLLHVNVIVSIKGVLVILYLCYFISVAMLCSRTSSLQETRRLTQAPSWTSHQRLIAVFSLKH